jgi:hypothetical protein
LNPGTRERKSVPAQKLTGIDALGGSCGPAPTPANKGSTAGRNIGYYESWANTRQCDRVRPQDLDLFGLSHLNFAFAFFHPTTFEVTAMDKNAESLLQDFTALRSTKPGLETWISVGGWTFNDETNRPKYVWLSSFLVSNIPPLFSLN